MKNYGVVDDSRSMLAEFIEGSLKLYAQIIARIKRRMDNKTENPR